MSQTNREKGLTRLTSFAEETVEVACTRCDAEETVSGEYYDSLEYFYNEGWRATEKHCYCPNCSEKFKIK